jgi:hypothetical protein
MPDTTNAIVRTSTVNKMKTFNNQRTAGVFLGSWDGTRHDGDLVTDIELSILGIKEKYDSIRPFIHFRGK